MHAPHLVGVVERVLVTLGEQSIAQAAAEIDVKSAALLAPLRAQA